MTKKVCKTTLTNINDLSEELYLKIFSFLSTKRYVVTSVLSKQWKYLWTKVPTLKFDKSEHNDYISFKLYVDKSVFEHQSHVLESFNLKVANTFLDENIGLWIKTTLHRHHCQLRELEIDAEHILLQLPRELLTIKILGVLKLKGKEINVEAPLTTVCLPSLKTLHHHSRRFDFDSLQMLLSSCNLLTDLIVTRETTLVMVSKGSLFFEYDISWCKALVALKLEG
ncbi:putative F-box/FBD/LRR-repeat protein [Cardamine amara subsp. amara]|uniref:F-box/FBD/LRR-repeat protein n=1 Tax=Cardamine amara subsp. amara TaxID=228776 RepID=A0ABD1BZ40_CARAN